MCNTSVVFVFVHVQASLWINEAKKTVSVTIVHHVIIVHDITELQGRCKLLYHLSSSDCIIVLLLVEGVVFNLYSSPA
jgi:hypothetical protein